MNGGPRALESLRQLYWDFTAHQRQDLLDAVGRLPADRSDRVEIGEAILVEALEDQTILESTWSSRNVSCVDPSLGEIAASLLSQRLSLPLDLTARAGLRDRRIAEVGNQWLSLRGLPLMPLPEAPGIPVADPDALAMVEASLREAVGHEEEVAALSGFRTLGLAGLAPLTTILAELPFQDSVKSEVEPVVRALASTVREVVLEDGAGLFQEETREDLHELIGAPLQASRLVALLREHVGTKGQGTIEVRLHRDGAGAGVSLRIIATREHARASQVWVRYSVRNGRRFLPAVVRHYSLNAARTPQTWTRFKSRLDKILLGQAQLDGELKLRVGWNNQAG